MAAPDESNRETPAHALEYRRVAPTETPAFETYLGVTILATVMFFPAGLVALGCSTAAIVAHRHGNHARAVTLAQFARVIGLTAMVVMPACYVLLGIMLVVSSC